MTVRAGRRRFFVPVLPVVLVLAPLLLLAVLGGLIACRVYRISALGALRGLGRLLWALPGARFEIDDGQTAVRVSVR
ncbi:hypothetical protein Ato02nite_029830 [Paractinoplanes toevensis]|uniref:Uncharacterized protein n=1 Tax=Paractinoplanes toevensis TaxID=571911 RepID=A0A919W446_9ACTN|nr:hypothetical protein Ato02nite_029830 [Actinoplanes toevensis]